MRRLTPIVLAGLALVISLSCSATYPTPPLPQQSVGLQVQYSTLTPDPRVGRPVSLVAYVVDSDGGWTDVTTQATWLSANSAVARLTGTPGGFVAVGSGSTDAIVSYGNLTGAIRIYVRPESSFPQLEFTSIAGRAVVGGAASITLLYAERAGSSTLQVGGGNASWVISDPSIVSIVPGGGNSTRFEGLSIGTTRVTASFAGQSHSLMLSVAPRQ